MKKALHSTVKFFGCLALALVVEMLGGNVDLELSGGEEYCRSGQCQDPQALLAMGEEDGPGGIISGG